MRLPLFPLHTVLFPDGQLPLRIFEVRYLDMIGRCEAEGTPFGVVGLTTGDEVRRIGAGEDFAPEAFHAIGTLARIEHIERPRAGLIGVRCRGGERFRLGARERLPHGLWMGDAEPIAPDQAVPLPEDLLWLSTRLQQWSAQLGDEARDTILQPPLRWLDCGWLANRFAEVLPLDLAARQSLMALENPLLRLELVADVVEQMDSAEASGGA